MRKKKKSVWDTPARLTEVRSAYDREALRWICEMNEADFAHAYEMDTVLVAQSEPDHFYHFKDNGSRVLAVAHLDTVGAAWSRTANFVDTEDGEVIFSRALDDRLGAYVILELLPALGIQYDILLTVGEESGRSTAAFFEPPTGKRYDWMIEFDRGGTDVVMYQYEDDLTIDLVEESGAQVGNGIFSDICYLEHLGIKGFNWGVGYQDYHGPRAHAFLDDTFSMVARFLNFNDLLYGIELPHEEEEPWWSYGSRRRSTGSTRIWGLDDDWDGEPDAEDLYGERDYVEYPTNEEITEALRAN